MKKKLINIHLIALVLWGLLLPNIPLNLTDNQIQAEEEKTDNPLLEGILFKEPEFPVESLIPGRVEGSGNYFEVRNSEYLNITLHSSNSIKLLLQSLPEIIIMQIEPISDASKTEITLSGFSSWTTYYKYEDDYHNLVVFTTDEVGSYTYIQDLSRAHLVFIQPRKGTKFIRDDVTGGDCLSIGIWDPITKTCTLTKDLNETIQIDNDDITIDGNNHTITGTHTGFGVYLNKTTGVTIKKLKVNQFSIGILFGIYPDTSSNNIITENTLSDNYYGINLFYADNNTFIGNIVSDSSYQGIYLESSDGNTFINNTISNSFYDGIYLKQSINNTLINNTILDNFLGISLYSSGNNVLTGNTIRNNRYNFYVLGTYDNDFDNSIDTSNLVDGKPIYYVKNASNKIYDSSINAGVFYCINCNNITIKELTVTKNYTGVFLWKTQNSRIENVFASDNAFGISLFYSSNNILTGNNLSNNYYAISFYTWENYPNSPSSNNTLIENTISDNHLGIYLQRSNSNVLIKNTISKNIQGICLQFSNNNVLTRNTITKNTGIIYTFGIYFENSSNNTLVENIISNNSNGIYIFKSDDNKIYHNNFIDNYTPGRGFTHVYIEESVGNLFDDSYPSGGNYWSDYVGEDKFSGPKQDQPGSDGIGDNPYVFPGGQDNYPFIKENGWELPSLPEKWSFAIITDLHIGRGYPDYGTEGFEDDVEDNDYYLTKRLEAVVNWIIYNKDKIDCEGTKCSIKFLAVLGDISDSAEKSEFLKAKKILDKLNDYGIPYVPVFGNHDVCAETEFTEANCQKGQEFFENIFFDENATNTKLLQEKFNFQKDTENPNYKNSAFTFGGINFINLDFNKRIPDPRAKLWDATKNWLIDCLVDHKKCLVGFEGNKNIILSHIPIMKDPLNGFSETICKGEDCAYMVSEFDEIKQIIEKNSDKILANFGGHIHGFYPPILYLFGEWMNPNETKYDPISSVPILTTEALMVASNREDEYLKEHSKGIIRLIKILDKDKIDHQTIEGRYNPETGKGKEFIGLNPYLDFEYSGEEIGCVFFKAHAFTKRNYEFIWDYGDGKYGSGDWDSHCYNKAGKYDVTLLAKDAKTGFTEELTRKINIPESAFWPKVHKIGGEIKEGIQLISTTLLKPATEFGRTRFDGILIRVKHSPEVPVGLIDVHFEKASQDIDMTGLEADSDPEKGKSILYMPEWPKEVERSKVLYVPIPKNK